MPWTPEAGTIDARAIVANLLTYFQTNQSDALLWAHGSALKDFQQFADSIANRVTPVFPSIAFKRDSTKSNADGDLVETEYSLVFEMVIENQSPTLAVSQGRSYAKAVASMILNCPNSTLLTNTGAVTGVVSELADNFQEIKANDMQNDFFQEIEIGVTYSLVRGLHA